MSSLLLCKEIKMAAAAGVSKRVVVAAVVIALILGGAVGWIVGSAPAVTAPRGLAGTIVIGGLLPLSGGLGSFGKHSKVAMELAASEVNDFFASLGIDAKVELRIEDTETKPEVCLEKLQALHAAGVKFFVGPMSSGELSTIKEYAGANKLLIVSQSSTAPALAIPGDFVFRLCPDDTKQGPAIARTVYDSGVEHLIIVYRQDTWGEGLKSAVKEAFEKLGGVVEDVIGYPKDAKDFSAEASTLNSKVSQLISKYGADSVGVNLIAFEEAVQFFIAASEYESLKKVRWFGSDGTALSSELIKDQNRRAAAFAAEVKFLNTIFTPTSSPKFEKVKEHVERTLGETPDAYAYSAYDAVWLIALSVLAAGKPDPVAVKQVLPKVAELYFGAAGWTKLNEAGDLGVANYDLWVPKEVEPGKFGWVKAGTYVGATDSITWLTKP